MKSSLLSLLTCRRCGGSFRLTSKSMEGSEVMEGDLICQECSNKFPIVRGIPRFLDQKLEADKKATADAFAYEWTHYSRLTEGDKREFLAWIAPLQAQDFQDQVVLDAGVRKTGRHIFLAAEFECADGS